MVDYFICHKLRSNTGNALFMEEKARRREKSLAFSVVARFEIVRLKDKYRSTNVWVCNQWNRRIILKNVTKISLVSKAHFLSSAWGTFFIFTRSIWVHWQWWIVKRAMFELLILFCHVFVLVTVLSFDRIQTFWKVFDAVFPEFFFLIFFNSSKLLFYLFVFT